MLFLTSLQPVLFELESQDFFEVHQIFVLVASLVLGVIAGFFAVRIIQHYLHKYAVDDLRSIEEKIAKIEAQSGEEQTGEEVEDSHIVNFGKEESSTDPDKLQKLHQEREQFTAAVLKPKMSRTLKILSIVLTTVVSVALSVSFVNFFQTFELLSGVGNVATVVAVGMLVLVAAVFALVAVPLAVVDQKTMRLPTRVIYGSSVVIWLLLAVMSLLIGDPTRIVTMVACALGLWIIFFVMWFIQPKGFGFGDVRLTLLIGAVLGFVSPFVAVVGVMLGFVLMSLFFLPLMIVGKVGRKTKAPLGPWLLLGTVVALLIVDIIASQTFLMGVL